MEIPKAMIVEKIRSQSGDAAAEKADAQLPEKANPDEHAQLLQGLGLDPEKLKNDFGGQSPVAG